MIRIAITAAACQAIAVDGSFLHLLGDDVVVGECDGDDEGVVT